MPHLRSFQVNRNRVNPKNDPRIYFQKREMLITVPYQLYIKYIIISLYWTCGLKKLWQQQLPSSLSGSPWRLADTQMLQSILYLLQVLLLHGQQVAPGDVIFLCMCVCEKPENITQHLPNQNFYSCSWPHHLKQMYLHEALPSSDNTLPAPVKPSLHISDRV